MFQNLTAVTVTYNSGHIVYNLLKSLKKLKIKTIVVDNQSSDNTLEVVKKTYPSAKIINSPGNIGFGRANNLGLKAVRTKYVLIINPDAIVNKDAINKLIEAFKIDKTIAVTSPKFVDADKLNTKNKSFPLLEKSCAYKIVGDVGIYVKWVSGGCMIADMQKLKKIGFFDENIFLFYEDDELCWRICNKGFSVVLVSNASIVHKATQGSKPSKKVNKLKLWHFTWSYLYLLQKSEGFVTAKMYALKKTVKLLVKLIGFKNFRKNIVRLDAHLNFLIGRGAFKNRNEPRV